MMQFGPDAVGIFRVAVKDSGVGLSEVEQGKLFGEFTQFNKNELQGGGILLCFCCASSEQCTKCVTSCAKAGLG